MNAFDELQLQLQDNEHVEGIVFGTFGWNSWCHDAQIVPTNKQGILMSLDKAKPYLEQFKFRGGYGSPDTHAVYIWTNLSVFFVSMYDGATALERIPRNPMNCMPEKFGG